MSKFPRLPAALVAACLTVGLSAGPAVAAPSSAKAPAAKSAQKKKPRATTESLRKRIVKNEEALRNASRTLRALNELTKTNGNGVAFLTAAAPQLVAGLTQLRDASFQLRDGLLQIRNVLETQVQPALVRVRDELAPAVEDLATSQEYGITRISVGGQVLLPFTFGSADIPDDGNPVSATGEVPIVVGPNPAAGQVPPNAPLLPRSAIRSGEDDGEGDGDPAGFVGGLLTMKCASAQGCDLNPDPNAETVVPPGTLVCSIGPAAPNTIPTPEGDTTQPLVRIQEAAGRTQQDVPSNSLSPKTVNPLQGAASQPAPLNNNAADGCNNGSRAGDIYTLLVQTQFVDIPTSSEPEIAD